VSGDPLQPLDPAQVVWEARPTLGIVRQDVLAAGATLGLCMGVLGGGLTTLYAVTPARALQVAAIYGAFVAAVVTLARAIGASGRIHGALAGFLGATVMAGLTRGEGGTAQVVCSLLALLPVGVALAWRLRQRLRTRYRVTPERVAMGEVGHYTITFAFSEPPRVTTDVFGADLAEVSFRPQEARLITREGKVFKLAGRPYRLHRVRHPQQLLAAIGARPG
jgi:hypothetical protein